MGLAWCLELARGRFPSIHRVAEKAHSRKLALAKSVPTSSLARPGAAGYARNTPGRRDKVSCVTRILLQPVATRYPPVSREFAGSSVLCARVLDRGYRISLHHEELLPPGPPLPVATGPIHQRRTHNRLAPASTLPVKVYYLYPVPRHENYPTYMRALVNNFVSNPEFVYVS